jgi:hypothetical protein
MKKITITLVVATLLLGVFMFLFHGKNTKNRISFQSPKQTATATTVIVPTQQNSPTPRKFHSPHSIPTVESMSLGREGENLWLGLYAYDETYSYPVQVGRVAVSANAGIQAKLDVLSKAISQKLFQNLKITAVASVGKNGNTTAKVELKNIGTSYYQGSAMGGETTTKLVESYLQRSLSEEWIEGVIFLFDGKPWDQNPGFPLDHCDLSGEFHRNTMITEIGGTKKHDVAPGPPLWD